MSALLGRPFFFRMGSRFIFRAGTPLGEIKLLLLVVTCGTGQPDRRSGLGYKARFA
jgi:hypothetical protein